MATTPVAGLPNPQSFDQLNSDMLSTYASKIGVDDFNVGSAVTSFFETVALTTARAAGDIFQILRDFSIDRATGDALKNLAIENRVTPITARPATGPVTVIDTSFNKIATKIYAGANPPNIGSVSISVSDASLMPPTGSVYIGRGTPNVEGPLPYTLITPTGGFFVISLSVPTSKFHNIGESVILAQGGNRSIPINAVVVSPALGSSPDIQFSVIAPAVILDGETTVTGVQVSALSPGSAGNVPAGAIKKFASPPFTGATVSNALPFTTGRDSETDDALRIRIKRAIASTGLGTATAVQAAVIGATPSDENATVVSDSLILNANGAILYLDDGMGYEAKSQGVGLESIVDSALGGEQFFQLATGGRQAPVAKAFLQSTFAAPYDLIGGDTLAVTVGEVTYQHIFADADFISPGGATAFEVTASINADTALGFEATTAGAGTEVVIRSKTEGNDSIQVVKPTTSGRDASVQLGFPSNKVETLRLYKNKVPLSKDGAQAIIFTQAQALWSPAIANGDTLILSVDGTSPITYTITDADFVATGLYTTVSATNSLEAWRQVLIKKLTGVTTTIIGQQLTITSNLGDNNRAQVVIDPSSTLVIKGMFSILIGLSSQGKASDFILSRNTAQFELIVPLVVGDQLSAGSDKTEARIQSANIPGGSIIFSGDAHFWLLIDSPGQIIPNGVAGNSVLVVSKPSTNIVRYASSNANAFINIIPGDYAIIWSAELNVNNRLEGRVHSNTNGTLDILVTAGEYLAAVSESVVFNDGFSTTRNVMAPQRFRVLAGNKTLDQIATELQAQTSQLVFSVQQESFLVVNTVTKDSNGSLLVITADVQGKLLLLPINGSDTSKESLIAYLDSATKDAQMPLFIQSTFAAGNFANPPDTFINSVNTSISFAGRDPNELISMLHPYGTTANAQPYAEDATTQVTVTHSGAFTTFASTGGSPFVFNDSFIGYFIQIGNLFNAANQGIWQISSTTSTSVTVRNALGVSEGPITLGAGFATQFSVFGSINDEQPYGEYDQVTSISGSTIGIAFPTGIQSQFVSRDIHRVRVADRFYIANPLDFGSKDTLVVVLDNNPSTESFEIPMFRRAIVNTTLANNPSNFNAYDVDSGPTANFVTAFGDFDFSNFKVLMRAKKVLKQTAAQTAILYRATNWGRSGEKITVTYTYPSAPNSAISSNVTVGATIDITLNLASGTVAPSAIDQTTEWNITVTPNTPVAGVDQVTYTWNGTGTAPAMTLVGGEYVNITNQTEFAAANTGIYRVSTQAGFTPTAVAFSIQQPTGVAVPQANRATNVLGAITFYQASPTTAAQMVAYVNANLFDITATLVNDGGITGAGVLTFSTFEDSNFVRTRIQLLDGINWILVNSLPGSPQFTLKVPLNESTDVGYAFNNGEEVRLIPTTQDQVRRFISILAVTGFTTTGNVGVVERGTKLELSTRVLGSDGAIQVIGGYGNGYQVPILDSAIRLDNTLMKVSVDKVASAGVHSDQWFRLQASTAQAKDDGFSSNTGVTIQSNNPITGRSLVTLSGRNLTQRYFGRPRNFIRTEGDTFRIEKQGALVCLSWTGVGTDPLFSTNLNFNDVGGSAPTAIETVSTPITFGGIGWSANTNFYSQAFQVPAGPSQSITQIQVDVIQNGGTVVPNSPVVVEIRAATSSVPDHFPTGPVLATSNVILANTLPTSHGTLTTFTFPTLVPLLGNGFYSFAVRSANTLTVNNLNIAGQAAVVAGLRAAETINSGTSWSSFGNGAFASYIITAQINTVGTINVFAVPNSNDSQYIMESGNANFGALSIGDLLTVSGLPNAANNGTFLVTGVSQDGTVAEVLNPLASNEFSSGAFTFSANSTSGDSFLIDTTTLVAGTDFPIGGTSQITAANLAAVAGTIPGITASANGNVVIITATNVSASIAISYTGSPVVTVTGGAIVGGTGAVNAQSDALAAYTAFAAHSSTAIPAVLDGQTLTTGYYNTGAASLDGGGALTFNGSPTDIFVVKTASTLVTGSSGTPVINLTGGALARNIYWIVGSSATINSGFTGTFQGNVIAQASITDTLGGTVNGSLIALVGAVTLSAATNVIAQNAPLLLSAGSFAILGASAVTSTGLTVLTGNLGISPGTSITGFPPGTFSGTEHINDFGSISTFLAGDSFVSGQFSSLAQVEEGDTMIVGTPFNVLNQGKYRIIRRYNNSVWFENPDVIEEEVSLSSNPVSIVFNNTTSFSVTAINGLEHLSWNGIGTEPSFLNVQVGDIVNFGADFAAANQGSFMVVGSGAKLPELTQVLVPPGSAFVLGGAGKYFTLYNSGSANKYYVWFNVNGTNTDPAPAGYTSGIMIAILSGDNATQVATKLSFAINGFAGQFTSTSSANLVNILTTDSIETIHATNFNVPSPFSITILQSGRRAFIDVVNPSASNQAAVLVTTSFLILHRPQLQFFEYEATVPNDLFTITSDVLGSTNQGSWTIDQVLDQNTAIVNATLAPANNISLNGSEGAVFVSEGTPYTGYKHVLLVARQPGAPTRNNLVFDTNAQYEKIDESAGVQMVSLGKEEFNTTIRKGLDSYRFNTGLIAEANRIIYGDPRDPITYPGVGAAGAEIFSQESLTRRIQISLVVRVNTGVPFSQIISQVRSSVSSLINSNDVGVPIAIGDIIAAVKAIPGVRAEAISSPQFDSTHDLIFLAPSEKARILDPTLDISVSQIGS